MASLPRFRRRIWPRRNVRVAAACVAALVLASCRSADSTGPGPSGNISLDMAHVATDSIGPAGGTLSITSASGITYTLVVPAGALMAPVTITMTPVLRHDSLPLSGGFAAGAEFEPAGLHFALPARFTASPVPAAPAGTGLAAVTFEGNGDSLALVPAFGTPAAPAVLIAHFSGSSFGFGTSADLRLLVDAMAQSPSPTAQAFKDTLAMLGDPGTLEDASVTVGTLNHWFDSAVLPGIEAASNDAGLLLAVADYGEWVALANLYLTGDETPTLDGRLPLVPNELLLDGVAAGDALAPQVREAIAGNNDVCLAQHDVQGLYNVLFWQGIAHRVNLGIDVPDRQLDAGTVIANLCGRIVADSVGLPDPLPGATDVSLDLVWGILIGESPPVARADFDVAVSASGATVQSPSGLTGPDPEGGPIQQGFFTTVVRSSTGSATFTATACLVRGGVTEDDFCGTATVSRGISAVSGDWKGGIIYGCANTLASADVFATIQGDQQSVSGTWTIPPINCAPNGIHGTLTATMDPVQHTVRTFAMTADAPATGCGDPPPPVTVTATTGTFGASNVGGVPYEFNFPSAFPQGPLTGSWSCNGVFSVQPTALALYGPLP